MNIPEIELFVAGLNNNAQNIYSDILSKDRERAEIESKARAVIEKSPYSKEALFSMDVFNVVKCLRKWDKKQSLKSSKLIKSISYWPIRINLWRTYGVPLNMRKWELEEALYAILLAGFTVILSERDVSKNNGKLI
jgi:hypothetical protein